MNMASLLTQTNDFFRMLTTWVTGAHFLCHFRVASHIALATLTTFPLALNAAEVSSTSAEHATPPTKVTTPKKNLGDQVREATDHKNLANKRLTLVVNGKEKKFITIPVHEPAETLEETPPMATKKLAAEKVMPALVRATPVLRPPVGAGTARSREVLSEKMARQEKVWVSPQTNPETQGHWSYEGETGPQAWGSLKKEFTVCAIGKRQAPINIEETTTLQGPAEPLQFNYQPSSGTVVNNGHTIQVDLTGDNTVTVRGSIYKLLQFHFHTPSEERVNGQGFAMVAHLVHKNAENQLAVVAVLLEPGVTNSLIHQVWTYMPLDSGDRVSMPTGLIDMNALLPKDPRYYQFMGSLTTPPCTEGVLWMVMKQATTMSKEQIKLFTQIFPHNARPVQALNGRSVRDAQ
jgi:carbonic anhydrase